MKLLHASSPNFSSRKGAHVLATTIHFTAAMSARGSVSWLCTPASQASAHALIDRDGTIVEMVPLQYAAWHAGVAELTDGALAYHDPKLVTIGVELANCGRLVVRDGTFECGTGGVYTTPDPVYGLLWYPDETVAEGVWEPFPEAQLAALEQYLQYVDSLGYHDAATNCVGHDEIARPWGRKQDPGPLFPWDRFPRKTTRPLESR
jgi:N-acetylmuramoyl-L-alanine amidase